MRYYDNFLRNENLISNLGEDIAYLTWVMALFLDRDEIEELANNGITDYSDDKKIDFIDLDLEKKQITFAQGYYSNKPKDTADANKASDLNTAAAWLWSGDINCIPNVRNLRSKITSCRDAIQNGLIDTISIAYVHNLPESKNIRRELDTVQNHFFQIAKEYQIDVKAFELGVSNIEKLYDSKNSQIIVLEEIPINGKHLGTETASQWSSQVFSVSCGWLFDLYKSYGNDLFSANYRGFLGINKKRINKQIKATVETRAENFWAFNNGITLLTKEITRRNDEYFIAGISIINGAQTTGSIGSIDQTLRPNIEDAKVLCRIIKCNDPELIREIVSANNTQNEISSWDEYSNDPEQGRIAAEFAKHGQSYTFKRGFEAVGSSYGIHTIAQPTLAFEGYYADANRGKNNIFENAYLYKRVFEGKKARHLMLAYCLSKSIEELKGRMKQKYISGELLESEKEKYYLLQEMKFKMFFLSLIGSSFGEIMRKPIDKTSISISPEYAKLSLEALIGHCMPVIETMLNLVVSKNEVRDLLANQDDVVRFNREFNGVIASLWLTPIKEIFENFSKAISVS